MRWQPQLTQMIDFGWSENDFDSHWPAQDDGVLEKLPSFRKVKLSAIFYKHMHNAEELCGLQFGFTDGTITTLFETEQAKDPE